MVHRYLTHILLFLLAVSFIVPPLYADDVLLAESQPLPFSYSFGDKPLQAGSELLLSGHNKSRNQQLLIFRLDNTDSSNYYNRVNHEYSVPTGEFALTIPLTGLKTSASQPMPQPYSKMIIFSGDNSDNLSLNEARINTPEALPANTLALDFGQEKSPLFPGFQLITKNDPRIQGQMTTRFRRSGDALIQDGIKGIDHIAIPWANGDWKLSLWTQDQGEWEYLPHFLNRKIQVEQTELLNETRTIDQWVQQVYLAGANKEAGIDGDLWQLTGQRRSGLISKTITVNDGILNLSLEGDPAARYLSALVIEPVNGEFTNSTESKRRERFISRWPVKIPEYKTTDQLIMADISEQVMNNLSDRYLAAGGTLLNLTFEINSPVNDPYPVIAVAPPRSVNRNKLDVSTRFGHWRYERPEPNASSLIMDDSYLRSDMSAMTLSGKFPRRVHIQVNIPADTAPGQYHGSIQLFSNNQLITQDYQIEVMPVSLPGLDTAVGLYLEPAPYYQWFASLGKSEALATACDLSLLSTMGFSTLAPSLATPINDENIQTFTQQMKQLKHFGFTDPILAYAPLKRLLAQGDAQSAGLSLSKLNQAISDQKSDENLPDIYWSIFDEPSPNKFSSIEASAKLLHSDELGMKTAGHLNSPRQQDLASMADLKIINHGFGVTGEKIREMKKQAQVWLYNMPNPRLAAGAYLWKSGAQGYIQWHGRMPTADPFDPTDGREGDVIYLYPWQGSCPSTINIHRRLLDLHEAILDYRWLQWLQNLAGESDNDKAKKLLKEIQKKIPEDWLDAKTVSPQQLMEIRQSIMNLQILQSE